VAVVSLKHRRRCPILGSCKSSPSKRQYLAYSGGEKRGASKLRGRRLGPSASLRTIREANSISRDAKPIKRHRNPLGIFSRVLIYPLIGVGAWRHRLDLVAAGVALEALLWTAVPPVEETFGFVEDAIEKELDWLNAPPGPQKTLSFALVALFPIVLLAGLWRRSGRLLAASAALIVVFYFLMRRVAAKP
jgi:hypothetical protein